MIVDVGHLLVDPSKQTAKLSEGGRRVGCTKDNMILLHVIERFRHLVFIKVHLAD